MCGIAGLWEAGAAVGNAGQHVEIATAMAQVLAHRGPDDHGTWQDECGPVLAHRRLSIQDTSSMGHQPMHSACGRYVVVFNGEIYNFPELRAQLQQAGFTFNGHSDTEVLLAAVVHWGLEKSLQLFNGMFAFALWDRESRQLALARDRVGKKPLYYGWAGSSFVFASELKAIGEHPGFTAEVDTDAVALYLQHNYVPAPWSIYRGIYKLLPGSYLVLDEQAIQSTVAAPGQAKHFWDAQEVATHCMATPFTGDFNDALGELETLLTQSVERRLIADVPLGMLLSGGIDSTLVTAIGQSISDKPINTFAIGFPGEKISEAAAAGKVAQHLGTHHTELYVDAQAALDSLPLLPEINDEPLGDPSQIPTFLVSRLARQHVTVALSGDGGDELFFGYKRYLSSRKIWNIGSKIPRLLAHPLAALLQAGDKFTQDESKLLTYANCLRASHPLDVYQSRMAKFNAPGDMLRHECSVGLPQGEQLRALGLTDVDMNMMLLDFNSYLVDDILVKVDRAGMHESLELRNPLLDYTVVEFAWRLPMQFKLQDDKGKYILRRLLEKYVPTKLTDRPKQGFSPPLKTWLQGPLREWADELLAVDRLEREGIFNSQAVHNLWQSCKDNPKKGLSRIWTILMFQVWYEGNVLSRKTKSSGS